MNENMDAFLRILDPCDNSTGGGSASCVAGAMAAGLVGMVARLSMGKEGLAPAAHYETIAKRATELSRELFDAGRLDAQAFAAVSAAYKMPKQTSEQKAQRSQAIRKGMRQCAEVPLHNARLCREVLDLAQGLALNFNPSAASDLECARLLALAGLQGCAANVRINLPYLKDPVLVKRIETTLAGALSNLAETPSKESCS